jgi:superfamily II DNA or RNA helicase
MIKQKITGPSKVSIDTSVDEILHLREENFRLKALLESHGISWEVDIAVMQSLSKREDIHEILDSYGQIIIDECHHISAFSFEAILKQAKAQYILGLTATPVRRDGHQPIIFMQCGPI